MARSNWERLQSGGDEPPSYTDEDVKRAADAICLAEGGPRHWKDLDAVAKRWYCHLARAALDAYLKGDA